MRSRSTSFPSRSYKLLPQTPSAGRNASSHLTKRNFTNPRPQPFLGTCSKISNTVPQLVKEKKRKKENLQRSVHSVSRRPSYTQLRLRINDLHQDTYQIMHLVTVAVRRKLLNTISFTVHPTLKHETISKHFSRIITITLAVLLSGDPNLLSATKSVMLCSWRVAALPWPTRCASSLSPLDPFSFPPPTFDLLPPHHPTFSLVWKSSFSLNTPHYMFCRFERLNCLVLQKLIICYWPLVCFHS